VEQILSRYLPRDNEVAWNAQRKRGLIGTAQKQESDGQSWKESDGVPEACSQGAKTTANSGI
jgi:hypothetical protein